MLRGSCEEETAAAVEFSGRCALGSQGLEHVDALFGVSLANHPQRLVLVASVGHDLPVQQVVVRQRRRQPGRLQLGAQRLNTRPADVTVWRLGVEVVVVVALPVVLSTKLPHVEPG